jgi:16S rRNA (guanine527-N7)-methyltransferase
MNAEQFQRQTNVSRETLEMYQTWLNLLNHWNKRINLVARSTLHDFWLRHALDSWQVAELLPQDAKGATKTVLDMGAGAGFPGIAMAIALRDTPKAQITLVESNGKKCNFLRTVIRELNLPAKAVQTRIENFEPPKAEERFHVITARAFAPLPKLLKYSHLFWGKETVAILPKGESWQAEVDEARKTYDFDLETSKSQTNADAKILTFTNLKKHLGKEQIKHEA